MSEEFDIAVVIHNTNTCEWLQRCLKSIYEKTRDVSFAVWLVDNASTDGSVEMVQKNFPQVHIINPKGGIGVAAGFNAGIRASKSRYYFIQDADIEYTEDILSYHVRYMDNNPSLAAMSCPFYWPDGRFFSQSYCRHLTFWYSLFNFSFLGKIFKKQMKFLRDEYEYAGWDRRSSRYIDIVDTALILRRKALDEVGLYDEKFKIYCTQDDLCRRFHNAGWGTYCLADRSVIHAQHQSVRKVSWARICQIYRDDTYHYLEKWYGTRAKNIVKFFLESTRLLLQIAIFLKLYSPKKNMAFGTEPKQPAAS